MLKLLILKYQVKLKIKLNKKDKYNSKNIFKYYNHNKF